VSLYRKPNAPGESVLAYVIAHEMGHHVQNLLGYTRKAHQARHSQDKAEGDRMLVRLELQADYLAGVWAYHGQKKRTFLEKGNVELALDAAFQKGDEMKKRTRAWIVPDSFTHGTSQQRMKWFNKGLQTGDVQGASALFDLPYDEL
jgi:predicted metalloprotease